MIPHLKFFSEFGQEIEWSFECGLGDGLMSTDREYHPAVAAGIGFGTALAITISWSVHHSLFWAIIHGLLSWFYVVYWALFGATPWEPVSAPATS